MFNLQPKSDSIKKSSLEIQWDHFLSGKKFYIKIQKLLLLLANQFVREKILNKVFTFQDGCGSFLRVFEQKFKFNKKNSFISYRRWLSFWQKVQGKYFMVYSPPVIVNTPKKSQLHLTINCHFDLHSNSTVNCNNFFLSLLNLSLSLTKERICATKNKNTCTW